MKYLAIGATAIFAGICVLALIIIGSIVSTLNTNTRLKNAVQAQMVVRDANFDKMWKVIEQKAAVTKASAKTRVDLVKALIEGRGAAMVKIVHESNPESAFSGKDYELLSGAIESQRQEFFREEKFLLSKYQEYANHREGAISGTILNLAGRGRLSPPITITSDKTKKAAESGEDNDTKLDI